MDDYIWARDALNSPRFYPILNRSSVGLAVDIPINIGYGDDDPHEQQVLGIHYGGLGSMASSAISTTGPHHAQHEFRGGDVQKKLLARGIISKTPSLKSLAEEAPEVYKDVEEVVGAVHGAGLAKKVARLKPLAVIKG